MKFIADFHIHSKYSRATSSAITIDNLATGAAKKGIDLMGTGDLTHPLWFKELSEKLMPIGNGLFELKKSNGCKTQFILTGEISSIYSKNGKVRKIHNIVAFPSLLSAQNFSVALAKVGNIHSDGRPIVGTDAKTLLHMALEASPDALFIPGHCLTPWFSVFGSKSGFDTLEECFEDLTPYIYAMETGLSADPAMIWRIPDGRRVSLVSNSDAHSIQKLGREANFFNCEKSYFEILETLKKKDKTKFLNTIEFFPQEGKYFHDGHANCQISFTPQETKDNQGICPVCGQKVVVGVLNRVEAISDKPAGFVPDDTIPFKSIVPLEEIIAYVENKGVSSKSVQTIYENIIKNLGNEFYILLDAPIDDIQRVSSFEIAEAVRLVRNGLVKMEPGYDGKYGKLVGLDIVKKRKLLQNHLI